MKYAINTSNGIGKGVGIRFIEDDWPLVEGESFTITVLPDDFQNLVLAEDGVSLRAKNSAEELVDAKFNKIRSLKEESVYRANLVFGDGDVVFNNVGQLRLLQAQFNSFQTDGSIDPLLVSVNNVRQAYQDAKDAINALATIAEVEAYNVVTDPLWP